MVRELQPNQSDVSCDVCGRTILKGERTEAFLAPGGQIKTVCELCTRRAEGEGWIRESAAGEMPSEGRWPEPRPGLLARLWRRRPEEPQAPERAEEAPGPQAPTAERGPDSPAPPGPEPSPERPPTPRIPRPARRAERRRTDARHVRAVPTNAQVKVERALELFNATPHTRTIAGIARSLGDPWVSAVAQEEAPSEVTVVVAWELSWYRYRVDLGDAETPVTLEDKGFELSEIDERLREWNAAADAEGQLTLGVRSH
jgi:hypothetical protein